MYYDCLDLNKSPLRGRRRSRSHDQEVTETESSMHQSEDEESGFLDRFLQRIRRSRKETHSEKFRPSTIEWPKRLTYMKLKSRWWTM
jgi:hypothetical protein